MGKITHLKLQCNLRLAVLVPPSLRPSSPGATFEVLGWPGAKVADFERRGPTWSQETMIQPTTAFLSFFFSTGPYNHSWTRVNWLSLPQLSTLWFLMRLVVLSCQGKYPSFPWSLLSCSCTLTTEKKNVRILPKKDGGGGEKKRKRSGGEGKEKAILPYGFQRAIWHLLLKKIFSCKTIKSRYSWEWFWGLGVESKKKVFLFTSYPSVWFH